jgi:Arc/MetJ-type ribon-helix-helix transcriptional regulator
MMATGTKAKKAQQTATRVKSGEPTTDLVAKPRVAKSTRATKKAAGSRRSAAPRHQNAAGGTGRVAQVRLGPDEVAAMEHVMQALNLGSTSDVLREGLRLLARKAAEVAAAEEIRDFYRGEPAPPPDGALAPTSEELAAADEAEW